MDLQINGLHVLTHLFPKRPWKRPLWVGGECVQGSRTCDAPTLLLARSRGISHAFCSHVGV